MIGRDISRRSATRHLLLGAFAGSFLGVASGQGRRDARELVDRVQDDLQRAADFTRNNEKERERYHNAQHHLSEFDRKLRDGHFDKDKLDAAIDDVKNLVEHNTLESRDRDELARDLADLRVMRDVR
jgi:hypothetical protein